MASRSEAAASEPGSPRRSVVPSHPAVHSPWGCPTIMGGPIVYRLLVGGLEHEFYFPIYLGNVIIPIDFHIFQRGSNHQPVYRYL